MIIFNEKKYVEEKIITPQGTINDNKELMMFIRYFHECGFDKQKIQIKAKEKAKKHTEANDKTQDDFLFNDVYEKAVKRKPYANEPTSISKCEYDWIRQVNDVEKEKVLFTLLIIQRFLNLEFIKITYKDLRELSMTKKQNDGLRKMIDELQADGYLKRITDKTYGVTMPECDDNDKFIIVADYNHIPALYLRTLKTKEYFYCEWCGIKSKYKEKDRNNHYRRVFCEKCSLQLNKIRDKS